jgi:putative acetyltransferase
MTNAKPDSTLRYQPVMAGSEFNVRRARVEDAEALVDLHYEAVHAGAKDDYATEVLDSWSPPPDEHRYAWMRSQIGASRHDILVAEANNALVIGFCMYAPAEGFIRAVYVASGWARMGVGRVLLRRAEAGIAERGTAQARLNASRNALQFYLAEGYEVIAATTQALADGSRMECDEMRKNLPVTG